jgi:hypothetical protein
MMKHFIFLFIGLTFAQNDQQSKILIPKLYREFEILNERNDIDIVKWISIYVYEDNGTLLQINEKKIGSSIDNSQRFRPTRNNIFLQAHEFKKIFFFLINDKDDKMLINNDEYQIHAFRSRFPYYITILKLTGRLSSERWRGLVFDWREIDSIMKNASSIMHDLNV